METIVMVLAPLLTVIVFVRSKRHFTLFERINGKMELVLRYPPIKGRGSLPWLALPVSALVLVSYVIRLITWLQAHLLLVILVVGIGALVTVMWRKRSWIMDVGVGALIISDETSEFWRNQTLPDLTNND